MVKMVQKEESLLKGSNPYNKNKDWDDEGKTGKPFVSADDSMSYVEKKKYAVMDKMENKDEPKEEAATAQPPAEEGKEKAPELYKKVDYKKRYDDLKRHYDKKINEFKSHEKELKNQIREARPKYTPPKSDEELEEFKKDNPDIYNVVETISHMQSEQKMQDLQEELKTVRETLQLEEARRAYMELKNLVPDYEQIRQDEDFHMWAEQQPQQIQDWVYNNRTDATLAAQAINLYKASKGVGQQPPIENTQEDVRGSADLSVSVRSNVEEPSSNEKVWTHAEIDAMSLDQYEQHRDEIDRAFAEGRIVNG